MPLAPCRACAGRGHLPGIGGRKIECDTCEGSGGGADWVAASKGLLLLLHRGAAGWKLKLVLGEHASFSRRFGGRARHVRPTGTSIAVLGTIWETLAEAQRGAALAAGLLVERARRPRSGRGGPGVVNWTATTCKLCKGAGRIGIGARLGCPDCGGVGSCRFVQAAGRWWVDHIHRGKEPNTAWVVRVAGNVRAPVESVPMSWRVVDGLHIGRGRERYQDVDAAREVAGGIVRELRGDAELTEE